VTFQDFVDFLRQQAPTHVEIQSGKDNMIRAVDHTASAEAFIKYEEGLDFSLQGVLGGEKGQVRHFSFKNEQELISVVGPLVLQLLDGTRRI
jgi:hypothetical protein